MLLQKSGWIVCFVLCLDLYFILFVQQFQVEKSVCVFFLFKQKQTHLVEAASQRRILSSDQAAEQNGA